MGDFLDEIDRVLTKVTSPVARQEILLKAILIILRDIHRAQRPIGLDEDAWEDRIVSSLKH